MSDKQKGEEMGQDADDLFFAVSRSLHCPSLRWVGPQSSWRKIPWQVRLIEI
mgnify:CR=1 FL=1